ncbi:MAG: T9SS type A sorting domain-containing protein [Saprospiraceae bacterium]|nr:T9SS type A sorting domain-containing protein [Saprospiraceae bacterium]
MKITRIILFCILYSCFSLQAQTSLGRQVVAAAGENATTPQISLSWTAGEAVVGPASGGGLALHQGFQQPLLQIVSTDEAALRERFTPRLYPNPTASVLHIERPGDADNAWNIRVYSVSGQHFPIPEGKLAAGISLLSVDLSELPTGQYFLQVQGEKPGEAGAAPFQKIR